MTINGTKFLCIKCHQKFNTQEEADNCQKNHYKLKNIFRVLFKKSERFPRYIVCDFETDEGIKKVTYVAIEEELDKK